MNGRALLVAGLFVAGIAQAQETQPAKAGSESHGSRPGGLQKEQMAKFLAARQQMLERDAARIDEDLARFKDNSEVYSMLAESKKSTLAMVDLVKQQLEAAKAGDETKFRELGEQAKGMEAASGKLRMPLAMLRQAADTRLMLQRVPDATGGDAQPAQQNYVQALDKLADFYVQQAKNPTGESRGGMSVEFVNQENDLKTAAEKARIEFDYQASLARIKQFTEKAGEDAGAKADIEKMRVAAKAVYEAQLSIAEAQKALQKAVAERRQAEESLQKTRVDGAAPARQKKE